MSSLDNTLASETSAGPTAPVVAPPRTALLYADESLLAHVEQALGTFGVPVVYRAAIANDHSALAASHPEVALINLDDRCGEELDSLTAMLDAAGVPIVFNDADISKGLEGWARARWARHLCAKLGGHMNVDPPRPSPGALATTSVVAEIPATTELPMAPGNANETPESATAGSATASGPLSKGEIDSLLADFPTESAVAGADTEALSAHIDALLADTRGSAAQEPAPWEVVGFADETSAPPEPAMVAAAAVASAPKQEPAAAPAVAPAADQWQLLDEFVPASSAGAKAAKPEIKFTDSVLKLELEPLAPAAAPTVVREGFVEMRLDEDAIEAGNNP